MDAQPDSPAATKNTDRNLPRLFMAGIIGWIVGTVLLFGASYVILKPESIALAMLWTLGRWWIGAAVGALTVVVAAVVSKSSIARPLAAFVLPLALLGVVAGLCLLIYPDQVFRDDLMTFLPVVLFFYAVAFVWMTLSKGKSRGVQFAQAVIPPVVGGLAVLLGVAVPAFASDEFRYRDTFDLHLVEARVEQGEFICDAVISIRKPESYTFSAPRYVWLEGGSDTDMGRFTWGEAGEPKGTSGDFPFTVRWRKSVPEQGLEGIGLYEDMFCLEIRLADGDGRVIHTVCEPIPRK